MTLTHIPPNSSCLAPDYPAFLLYPTMRISRYSAVGRRTAQLFPFQVTYVTLLGTTTKKQEKQTERPEGVFTLAG